MCKHGKLQVYFEKKNEVLFCTLDRLSLKHSNMKYINEALSIVPHFQLFNGDLLKLQCVFYISGQITIKRSAINLLARVESSFSIFHQQL